MLPLLPPTFVARKLQLLLAVERGLWSLGSRYDEIHDALCIVTTDPDLEDLRRRIREIDAAECNPDVVVS